MDAGTAKDFIDDLEHEINELRRQRDEWRELTEKALDQIEQWRIMCDVWQDRYNRILKGN